jgi:hypothetical protein
LKDDLVACLVDYTRLVSLVEHEIQIISDGNAIALRGR